MGLWHWESSSPALKPSLCSCYCSWGEAELELSKAKETKSLLRWEVMGRLMDRTMGCPPPSQSLSFLSGVPSGPRNVISIVNETSIILEWHPPRETGGRDDVTYNIVCKKCRSDRRACSRCDDNVDFVPRQLGLTGTRVFISSLWAHTPYTFEIQAVNGVSNKSPFPPQHISVNITTNQAGESGDGGFEVICCGCELCPQRKKLLGCDGCRKPAPRFSPQESEEKG